MSEQKKNRLELIDFNIEFALGTPTHTSFRIKLDDKYIIMADNLVGDVKIIGKEEA